MDYTTNYHLPQWAESDRIQMEDFNAAMENLENGITDARTALPYAVGRYTGTGGNMTIELGFRPSFLIISGAELCYPLTVEDAMSYSTITGGTIQSKVITFTDTGFQVNVPAENEYPKLTAYNRTYEYIAFR